MGGLVEFEDSTTSDALDGASVVGDWSFVGEVIYTVIGEAIGDKLKTDRIWAGLAPERDQAVLDIEFRLVDEPIEVGRAVREIVDEYDACVHICMVSV